MSRASCSATVEMEDHKYLADSGEQHVAAVPSLPHVCKHVIATQQPQPPVLGDTRHVGYSHGNKLVPSLYAAVSTGRSLPAVVLKGFYEIIIKQHAHGKTRELDFPRRNQPW